MSFRTGYHDPGEAEGNKMVKVEKHDPLIEQKKSVSVSASNVTATTKPVTELLEGTHRDQAASKAASLPRRQSRRISANRKESVGQTPTCGLCLEEFKRPKLLPCEHVFCMECLKPYVNPKNLLACPRCRKETSLQQVTLD